MTPQEIHTYIRPYRQLNWNDTLNLVHVAQPLFYQFDNFKIEQEIQQVRQLLNDNRSQKYDDLTSKVTKHYDKIKHDFNGNNNLINYSYSANESVFSDQKHFALITDKQHEWLLETDDQDKLQDYLDYGQYLLLLSGLQSRVYNGSQAIALFAKLIYYQNQDLNNGQIYDKNDIATTTQENPKIQPLIDRLRQSIEETTYSGQSHQQITIGQLTKLITNLQKHRLLDQQTATWLLEQNSQDIPFVKDIISDYQLDQKLTPCAKIPTELNDLVHELQKKSQVHIYQINNESDFSHQENAKIFIGIHGTKPFSVPSIVNEGLKNYASLVSENHQDFSYTGSGLGNGVYFARLNQFQKAINYTEGQNCTYLFIAEVEYHKAKHVNFYDNFKLKNDEDLIVGDGVGSHSRDEIVAPNNCQINTKYLIELIH